MIDSRPEIPPEQSEPPALQESSSGFVFAASSQLLILTAALILIFLFFATAIGFKKAGEAREDNQRTVAQLIKAGVPEDEARQSDRLLSPWEEGCDGAFSFAGKDNRETMARQTAIVGTAAYVLRLMEIGRASCRERV